MSLFRSMGVAARAYGSAAILGRRGESWLPFLLVAAVQLAALGGLIAFHHGALQRIALPIVRLLGGETATRYPFFFLLLPNIYSSVTLVIAVFVSSLAGGAATLYFSRSLGFSPSERVWGEVRRRAWQLILVTLVPVAAIVGLTKLGAFVPRDLYLSNVFFRWSIRGVSFGLIILIQALTAYTTAWVILWGSAAFPAIRDSFRVTLRTFLPTMFVVAPPFLLLYPLGYLVEQGDLFLVKLQPETIAGILAFRILAEIVLSFLLVGAVTRLFLWRMEETR